MKALQTDTTIMINPGGTVRVLRSTIVIGIVAAVGFALPSVASARTPAQASSDPVKIGVVTAESGAFASSFGPSVAEAAQARLKAAGGKVNGQKVELITADTQSMPANTLTQIRDLVENKGVFAILAPDPFLGTAAAYLKENNVPTISGSWAGFFFADKPEMFSFPTSANPRRPGATQWGDYYNFRKGTKIATFAVAIPPSSAQNATAVGRSAEAAGLDWVYQNHTVPPSGYDYTGDAQAMKEAGVDSLMSSLPAAETVRLVAAAKQAGLEFKAALLLQGYDQATLDDPAVAQALAGTDLLVAWTGVPSASATARTMVKNLNKGGLAGKVPTFGALNGYLDMDLALFGLEQLGRPVSATPADRAAFLDATRQTSDYTADGLLAGPYDLRLEALGTGGEPAGDCFFVARLNKNLDDFKPIRKKPFCGEAIPGTEVLP
jgi:ABC-type branched-subunit amino acid transport system substrate-binding protein